MQRQQNIKLCTKGTQNKIEEFLEKVEMHKKAVLNNKIKLMDLFLSTPNEDYAKLFLESLESSYKTIFDTNIYLPLDFEWFLYYKPEDYNRLKILEELFVEILNKNFSYLDMIIDMVSTDRKIIATRGIIDELSNIPYSFNKKLNRYSKKFDIELKHLIKMGIKKIEDKIVFLYRTLKSKGVLNEEYNVTENSRFRASLRFLIGSSDLDCCMTDKDIIYNMIINTLKEPTGVLSKDSDLFRITEYITKNIDVLNRGLKKHDLFIVYKKDLFNHYSIVSRLI